MDGKTNRMAAKNVKNMSPSSHKAVNVNVNISNRTILFFIIGSQATFCIGVIFVLTYLYRTPGSIYYNGKLHCQYTVISI